MRDFSEALKFIYVFFAGVGVTLSPIIIASVFNEPWVLLGLLITAPVGLAFYYTSAA